MEIFRWFANSRNNRLCVKTTAAKEKRKKRTERKKEKIVTMNLFEKKMVKIEKNKQAQIGFWLCD